jgi:hypothetical protein
MIATTNLRHAAKEKAGRTYSGYTVFSSDAKGKLGPPTTERGYSFRITETRYVQVSRCTVAREG